VNITDIASGKELIVCPSRFIRSGLSAAAKATLSIRVERLLVKIFPCERDVTAK